MAGRAELGCVRCRSVHSPNVTPPFIGMRALMRLITLASLALSPQTRFMQSLTTGCGVRAEKTIGSSMCICGTPIPPIGRLLLWVNPLPIARCQRGTQRMFGLVTGSLAAPIARAKTMGLRLIGRCYRCIRVSPRRRQICWLRENCLMATIVGYWLLMTMSGGF